MKMDERKLISIIVPIYNVEKYLEKCIDSLIKQTYENIEIFLIDDGSPDNCGLICDRYAELDKRIKVIHKKNGGLSDARNVAIDISKGEYITFVDSDDYVSENYVENLYNLILKYNVYLAVTLPLEFYEGKSIPKIEHNIIEKKFSVDEALRGMLTQLYFDNSAWAKIYHSSLFKDIRYPKGLIYEDVPTTYKLILKSNGVAFSTQQDYYYLKRIDSIEGSPFSKKKFDSVLLIIKDFEVAKKNNPKLQNAFNSRILSLLFHSYFETSLNSEYDKKLFQLIKKYRILVIFDKTARKKARIAGILSFSGKRILRYLYNHKNK